MNKWTILVLAGAMVISACDILGNGEAKDDVTLAFQASDGAATTSAAPMTLIDTGIDITSFMLSIREVEFKQDETAPDSALDVFFDGPYTLDLLDDTGPLTQTIGTVDIPPGTYQEIRFKLHKTTAVDVSSPLYDRSIYIAGTIDGTPFEMWHDAGENLDIGKATGFIVGEAPLAVTIDFNVQSFLDQSADPSGHLIDLTTATDDSGDGLIDINPNSDDGNTNQDLADYLKDNIKLVADIIES